MKQIKNLLLMAGFALAITFAFAFRPAEKGKHTGTFYFVYSGTTSGQTPYEQPGNWSEALDTDPGACNEGSLPCVVVSSIDNKDDFIQDIKDNGTGVVDNNVEYYRH